MARKILNDRHLSSRIAYAIIRHKDNFVTGKSVEVTKDESSKINIGEVKLVTSLNENKTQHNIQLVQQ